MVAEWKEFLWDVPEERIALWGPLPNLFQIFLPCFTGWLFFPSNMQKLWKRIFQLGSFMSSCCFLYNVNGMITLASPGWTCRAGKAVLSLLEFGQIAAAKQLQHKLSPVKVPSEFVLVDAALKLAAMSLQLSHLVSVTCLMHFIPYIYVIFDMKVLESLATNFTEGCGRGLCKRIIAVVQSSSHLRYFIFEAFDKQPIELLQLLSLKAQESFEEAHLLVRTHSMPQPVLLKFFQNPF
ncbi:unnamed protein product [Prunus armeniaca]|uniref:Uncharacterized protein n=1 Tax=Prunus armeniaca TaxID=36596 RepID=A0A6J5U0B8_PRUAR|nr:unnamed protein product [Prunus armeniaca]